MLFHTLLVFYIIQSQLPLVERRVRTKGIKLGWVTTIPGVDYSVISKHFWDYIGMNHIDTLVIDNQSLEICPDNVIGLTDQVSNLELLHYKVGLDPFVVPEVGIKWLRGC